MFAKNEPNALKDKRNQIERNIKLGKLSLENGNRQKVSIIQQNNVITYQILIFCLFTFLKA